SYTIAFKYLAAGETEGVFSFNPKNVKVKSDIPPGTPIKLTKTGNEWKQFTGTITVTQGNGHLDINFQNHTSSAGNALYLRDVMVTEN
ncbi:MAG: hypothetical protein M3347_08400, partial [Armatimonadota bacterium]|nr:hypothetical protein [Armatimonadota bacterium]